MKRWIGACSVFILLGACGVDDPPGSLPPPDMRECDAASVNWSAVHPLDWDEPLVVPSPYDTFDELMLAVEGEYRLSRGTEEGVLNVSRTENPPYQEYHRQLCRKAFRMPVKLVLTHEDKTWEGQANLWVGYEHIGYITDREVPTPEALDPLFGEAGRIEDLENFPNFGAQEMYPKPPRDSEPKTTGVSVDLYPGKRAELTVSAGFMMGSGAYTWKTWFKAEGERVR